MGGVETEFEREGHSDTSDFMCNLVLGSIMQPLAEASPSWGFSRARGDGVGTWHRALGRWNWLSLSPSGVQAGGPSPQSAHVFWLETLHPHRAHRASFLPPGKVPLSQRATGRGNGKSRSIPSPSQFPRALATRASPKFRDRTGPSLPAGSAGSGEVCIEAAARAAAFAQEGRGPRPALAAQPCPWRSAKGPELGPQPQAGQREPRLF